MKPTAFPSRVDPPPDVAEALALLRRTIEPTQQDLVASQRIMRDVLAKVAASPIAELPQETGPLSRAVARRGRLSQALGAAGVASSRLRALAGHRTTAWVGAGALAVLGGFVVGRGSASSEPPPLPSLSIALRSEQPLEPLVIVPLEELPVEHSALSSLQAEQAEASPSSKKRPSRRRSPTSTAQGPSPSLLELADAAVRSNRPRQALELLRQVKRNTLTKETVDLLQLLARCKLGQDVSGLRAKFLETWRGSSYRARLESECPRSDRS